MDNITFEAMPQAISELIQKVDTLQSTNVAMEYIKLINRFW